ncbi:MAG: recombination mediator RecR [Bacilli bacterium]
MDFPETLYNLIECFKKLPGVGEKTAQRYALAMLDKDIEIVENFSNSLISTKTKIKRCSMCNGYSEENICFICSNEFRDKETICIVCEPKNIYMIEKLKFYTGYYFVLNNLISPLDGINPEDVNLENLLQLIEKQQFSEVILALKPTIEGETTSLYISKLLEGTNIRVTKLANGIPIGIDMSYLDELTLSTAFNNRNNVA